MAILTFRNVGLNLGEPPLLAGVDFQIERGERLCLVGRNGAGKSTLLRLAAGELEPDSGRILRAQGLKVAQLAQALPPGIDGSVFHVVAAGLGELGRLLERYHHLAHAVAGGQGGSLPELERCQHQLEAAGGWARNQRVETVLSRLGLDADADVSTLSGGLQRRVLLAQALVSEPDLLLLDEPTNHLDVAAITWLEEFLLGWGGTLLFITHDRAFLERLATGIMELDRGRLVCFPGDYPTYLARRQAMLDAEAADNARFDKQLAREEAWIRQGIKARRTRNEGRVRALQRMREQRAARREGAGRARMAVQAAQRSGKLVAEAVGAGFGYGDRPVIRGLTTTILRGDKVGIIGPNGSGKTTLLRLLLGELEPTEGTLRRGTHLQVAYFDQHRAVLDDAASVQDNVAGGRSQLTIDGKSKHVLSYLQDFLFSPARARQPVQALSGGERNRLLLARLFAQPSNVLVLDEPTNDLDVETLELLEELLIGYSGTVLLVSHDRTFLNNVATSTLAFEGEATVNEYVGGYDDWRRQRPAAPATAPTAQGKKPTKARPGAKAGQATAQSRPRKLSYKDQRELDTLPRRIEDLEAERDALHQRMGAPDFYQQDKDAITRAQARLAELEDQLTDAYARWERLEAAKG